MGALGRRQGARDDMEGRQDDRRPFAVPELAQAPFVRPRERVDAKVFSYPPRSLPRKTFAIS
jgi:hypothetical protein